MRCCLHDFAKTNPCTSSEAEAPCEVLEIVSVTNEFWLVYFMGFVKISCPFGKHQFEPCRIKQDLLGGPVQVINEQGEPSIAPSRLPGGGGG